MSFKEWLEGQQLFPFMKQEDPPNLSKIRRYKSQGDYVKAQSRYATKTEKSAQDLVSAPPGTLHAPQNEEIVEVVPSALVVPAHQYTTVTRPERNIAFVHLQTKDVLNTTDPQYQKKQYRILAYWQGASETFDKSTVFDKMTRPLGGLLGMGGHIMDVWVDGEFRGNKPGVPNLYKAILEFAKQRGIHGPMPYNATCPNCGKTIPVTTDRKRCDQCGHYAKPLASRSAKAAQAKYDWKRAQPMLNPPLEYGQEHHKQADRSENQ